jgi:hypothetical protein
VHCLKYTHVILTILLCIDWIGGKINYYYYYYYKRKVCKLGWCFKKMFQI